MNTLNLYLYAIEKAKESAARRELRKVADAAGVDYSWLSKFALGRIPGASYQKVDQLARYYMERASHPPPPASELQQGAA